MRAITLCGTVAVMTTLLSVLPGTSLADDDDWDDDHKRRRSGWLDVGRGEPIWWPAGSRHDDNLFGHRHDRGGFSVQLYQTPSYGWGHGGLHHNGWHRDGLYQGNLHHGQLHHGDGWYGHNGDWHEQQVVPYGYSRSLGVPYRQWDDDDWEDYQEDLEDRREELRDRERKAWREWHKHEGRGHRHSDDDDDDDD